MKDFLSEQQKAVISAPFRDNATLFLEGPAGGGKTTAAIERVLHLLRNGVPAHEVLIIVPQRTLGQPYVAALQSAEMPPGAPIEVTTVGSLVRRHVELFWPVVARQAGFADPNRPPIFLNLEAAQYYMQRATGLDQANGGIEGVTISRNRLISQLLDNLNKAALVGFDVEDIAVRLKRAWTGASSRDYAYDQAQARAVDFRSYCLRHNLLDFSLQVEVFAKHLLPLPAFREYLFGRYRHIVMDNVEEDPPLTHDLLRAWLPRCESALIIYDSDGGYRAFLGADPAGGYALKDMCRDSLQLPETHVMTPDLDTLRAHLSRALGGEAERPEGDPHAAYSLLSSHSPNEEIPRYQVQMLDRVAEEIDRLVGEEGVLPNEIVVLAPFLSDALRFTLADRLNQHGVPVRSHRPSRALREEPATQCLLTLAALAHPHWKMPPQRAEVVHALVQAIEGLDLVRADLLAQIAYRSPNNEPVLLPFEGIGDEMRERLTYTLGERYDRLRQWLRDFRSRIAGAELDHFFSLLFGEVLSRPGFGFHRNFDAAGQTANLIESVRRFRQVIAEEDIPGAKTIGQEYVHMVRQGVLAAQYEWGWQIQPEDAVLLAPAYTFLMYNRPVDYQFWINIGSLGWWERIYQPLTHPYVLSRYWPADAPWTDADEFEARQRALRRLVVGLVRRCRRHIYLGMSNLNEQGYEESGPLSQAFNRMQRWVSRQSGAVHVRT